MQILNKRTGDFDPNDLAVLEIIASVAAAAIETAQLAREAQTAAIAHAVGDLSHDIKNKLSPIVLGIQSLRSEMDAMFAGGDDATGSAALSPRETDTVRREYGETFDIVLEQVQAIQEYTKLIADALKGTVSAPQLEPNDVAAVIEEQLLELDASARLRDVALERRFAAVPRCRFDRFQVERALYNLVHNALAETAGGGNVTVAIRAAAEPRFPDGRAVEIEVRDTGAGMSAEILAGILRGEPKSTKPGGTGLGTRIVYNAVLAHHGVLEGESTEGAGTTFRMRLPLLLD